MQIYLDREKMEYSSYSQSAWYLRYEEKKKEFNDKVQVTLQETGDTQFYELARQYLSVMHVRHSE